MELTGKTLRDFWIWYLLPEQRKTYKTSSLRGGDNAAKIRFLAMSFTERYGVFEDYFDSVDMDIVIERRRSDLFLFVIYCDKCSQAMIRLTQEMNKLSNNKKYKSIGSKYHN